MKVLVTGATGFVGRALVARLVEQGSTEVLALTRALPADRVAGVSYLPGCDLTASSLAPSALAGVDILIHTAARVHVLHDHAADRLAAFRRMNVDATLRLAEQAVAQRVRRFVFVSSIGVNGGQSPGRAFSESDQPRPHNAYALSKWEAEQGLLRVAAESGMEVVIIRPPLVYGPGVKANFAALMRAVQRGWPLPLGAVNNERCLVALDNLVDFILVCSSHAEAANQTFLVSDGQGLSTAELVRGLARAFGRPARLVSVPVWALRAGAALVGQGGAIQRLCGDLQVDISKARQLLGWTPVISVEEGLRRAVAGVK